MILATGSHIAWVQNNVHVDDVWRLVTEIQDSRGRNITLREGDYVVNGGPRLIRNGKVEINAAEDGVVRREEAVDNFGFSWAYQRNPRTMVGVAADKSLLLVAIDGRRPGVSVGASILEAAEVMRSLGAVDAMNLDGGGSTTMVVGGQVVNRPSDTMGERASGDAILIHRR